MAGSYHDKQDFKSDLKIEVAREGDILQAGQKLKDIECNKNPGHEDFISFKDLTLEDLPNEIRKREVLDKIKQMGNIVVRLVVDTITNGRLEQTYGSGFVFRYKTEYFIETNNHVVKTDDEAKQCTVEFHYDDDNRSGVLTSRGVECVYTCPYRDITLFKFKPVPDFVYKLDMIFNEQPTIFIWYQNNSFSSKKIKLGLGPKDTSQLAFNSHLDLNSSGIDYMYLTWPDRSFSYIKSSYFKFQPIPSNIQQFTTIEMLFCFNISIKIHMDEDEGNSRVILGDVVKFGDDFVVKISESIFQDKVKKCRLVWNGKVIGCGTRLYFQQIHSREMVRGIDLEEQMEQGKELYWLFEFHPMPYYIEAVLNSEDTQNVCCIGHPHGGPKTVTFGLWLSQSLETFDNEYRHITQPKKGSQYKDVDCVTYSCKTCPGSSGSPVFPLYEGMLWRISLIHFMGERVEEFLPSGELIENKNIAWVPTSPS